MNKMTLEYLPINKVEVSLSNVRKSNLEEGIGDLAKSIAEIGLQQPIVVFQKGSKYEVLIGQRRYLACKRLGLKEMPAIVTSIKSETDALVKSFSENIHRLDLSYRDKMQVANQLIRKLGTIDEVAKHLGVSTSTVRKYLGYSAVPEKIKAMVESGKLSASTALRITETIPDEKKAISIAEKIQEAVRGEDRQNLMYVAKENPDKDVDTIVRIAKKRSQLKKITIYFTEKIYNAITEASEEYEGGRETLVQEAVEEWLNKRGYTR